jgi:hypothetical protein
LPDISFSNEGFIEPLYFNYATIYGVADFSKASISFAMITMSILGNRWYGCIDSKRKQR